MLSRSPTEAFSSTSARASFSAGTLSPVRADSSDFKLEARQKPCVRGDEVARFQDDDVAGDELGGLDELFLAVAHDARVGGGHIFERFERLFRLALLHEPHDGVENDDEDDEGGLDELDAARLLP